MRDPDHKPYPQVVPGAGGLEANMFAEELFNMYIKYVAEIGFSPEITEVVRSSVGKQSKFSSSTGITKGTAVISGINVFGQLKFESGVHRYYCHWEPLCTAVLQKSRAAGI